MVAVAEEEEEEEMLVGAAAAAAAAAGGGCIMAPLVAAWSIIHSRRELREMGESHRGQQGHHEGTFTTVFWT